MSAVDFDECYCDCKCYGSCYTDEDEYEPCDSCDCHDDRDDNADNGFGGVS